METGLLMTDVAARCEIATDGGNLLLSKSESKALVIQEPMAEQYLRTYLSAEEFINGNPRFCLSWL